MEEREIRILSLEDSAIDADLIVRELKRAGLGFTTFRVDSEAAFRAALESWSPDVILADYHLPGFGGIEALKIALSVSPEIPFIFVSGSIGEDRAIQALREGAADYVIKDRLARLPSAITRALKDMDERQLLRRADQRLKESELRFRSVAQTASDSIILSDMEGRVIFWNDGAFRLFGYGAPEMLGQRVEKLMPKRYRAAHQAGLAQYRQTGVASVAGQILELEGLRKDGREFPLEMSLSLWQSEGETFCTAVMRDITSRVAERRRQRIQLEVARTLSEATSIEEVISSLLRNIRIGMGWQIGCWWRFDHEKAALRCTNTWSAGGTEAETILDQRRTIRWHVGEGLPGMAVRERKAVAADSLETSPTGSPPPPDVEAPVIRYAIAVPIVEGGEVTAVMEFLDTAPPLIDESFLEVMTAVGFRIGEFFERLRAEERLVSSEARLVDALELAKLGSFTFHPLAGRIEWSDQLERMFGGVRGEFENTYEAYLSRVHPDDREQVLRVIAGPFPREAFSFRHRIQTHDGLLRVIHCRMRVSKGTSEDPETIVGTAQDITEQVEAEEIIQRLSDQNRMILDFAAEGILGMDLQRRVIFANPAAATMTGWSVEELKQCADFHALVHHSLADGGIYPAEECPMFLSMADGQARSGDDTFWRKSGEPFPAKFSCSPMFEHGEIVGCVLILQDVAVARRMTSQLQQAQRVSGLGRVAATMAHEFNNVLMGIQPFAEVIKRRAVDEISLKACDQIMSSVTRGKRVTQEILRFTQPSRPAVQPVALKEWFEQLLPELKTLVGPGIEFVLKLPAHPVVSRGDPVQLQQVLTNLILNARDAMSGGGVLTISIRDEAEDREDPIPSGMVRIEIRDTGAGMPPEVLKNIFEPMFTTKRTGTGLGLAVAQQVLAQHSGSISVASEPGSGTTFTILLPAFESEPLANEVAVSLRDKA